MKQAAPKILTHDFILAFLALFALAFVFFILIPTLPIYLSRSGSPEVEIGVLIGIFGFSSLLLRPVVGRALLRIPEKSFMIAGALLYTLTSFAFLLAPPFWPFFIVRVFQGMGYAFFQTASMTLIANRSPESHRGQSISSFILAFNLSGALAPSLGIFLIDRFSFSFLFWVCTGLSLGSLFMASKLGGRQAIPSQDSSREKGVYLSRKAIAPSVIGFFPIFMQGTLHAFFPLYAVSTGVNNPGFFFTTIAIMVVLCRALGGKILDRYKKEKIILPCLTMYVLSMILLTFSKTLPMYLLVAVIWGIGHALLIPTLVLYTLDRVDSPGPAIGTFHAITDLGMGLGPVIMGLVLRLTSYPALFLCLAVIGTFNLGLFHFFVKKLTNRHPVQREVQRGESV
jgi:predicted MFS family arabinose efflux permease